MCTPLTGHSIPADGLHLPEACIPPRATLASDLLGNKPSSILPYE